MILRVYKRLLARTRYVKWFAMHPGVLRVTPEGLTLERYRLQDIAIELEPVWNFSWSEVRRICGFKRDQYTVDVMCILFELRNKTVEINEDMKGYKSVLEVLPARFPGLEAQWWSRVVFPPIETNMTTIWEEPLPPQPTAENRGG